MKGFSQYGVVGLVMMLTAVLVAGTGCESSSSSGDPLVATWRLISASIAGEVILVADEDLSLTLRLNSDGTATVTMKDEDGTETESGTWSATDTELTITIDGDTEVFSYVRDGKTLTITDGEGVTLVFRK